MPGRARGQTTFRKVVQPFAPRSPDASRYDSGTRSSAAYTGSTTNGNHR